MLKWFLTLSLLNSHTCPGAQGGDKTGKTGLVLAVNQHVCHLEGPRLLVAEVCSRSQFSLRHVKVLAWDLGHVMRTDTAAPAWWPNQRTCARVVIKEWASCAASPRSACGEPFLRPLFLPWGCWVGQWAPGSVSWLGPRDFLGSIILKTWLPLGASRFHLKTKSLG